MTQPTQRDEVINTLVIGITNGTRQLGTAVGATIEESLSAYVTVARNTLVAAYSNGYNYLALERMAWEILAGLNEAKRKGHADAGSIASGNVGSPDASDPQAPAAQGG